ncbi:symplekin [Sitophilus oryzae]|uniref:Symplekin n=1 Tax=Sitophilus oryzae TaxID=7048 RepID=A0A6J2XP09_SITOR|nr:symplekin [Sitophilus oryzae]
MSDEELIVENINNALIAQQSTEKVHYFAKIKELLLYKSPNLLSKYLINILNFATEKHQDVKRALVGFIEELCKVRENFIPQIMVTLHMLLCDESVPVQKRVIQAAISIYRRTLAWLCRAPNITDEMEECWKQLNTIKLEIANMIDSDNDGIRTSSVKFLECVVLLQSYPDEAESKKPNDFSLDNVPLTLKIARRRKLEEEASNLFELLVKFHGSPHISSANLLACIGVLTNIAKNRAEFMKRVVDALESLYNNLPPTLTTTQVSSVKKKLKTELSGLVKYPGSFDYINRLTPLLLDLGCSQNDINKMLPKIEDRRKYQKRSLGLDALSQQLSKKPRIDPLLLVDLEDNDSNQTPLSPQDVNEKFILDNLTLEKAIYLIITNIPKLPLTMPASFAKDYSKYVSSGRIGKEHLAGALAVQFVEAKVGPGVDVIPEKPESNKRKRDNKEVDEPKGKEEKIAKKEKTKAPKIKSLKLAEITKPLPKDTKESLLVSSVNRLLGCDKAKIKGLNQKIIITLASNFSSPVREAILTYLLSDLRSNIDTALAWLFEEYSIMQGFVRIPPLRKGIRPDECYNILLCSFIQSASHDAIILSRLLLEAPLVTDEALEEIKTISQDEKRSGWALGLLRDLTLRKPPKQLTFLNVLLSYTTYELSAVRDAAINHVLDLHKNYELRLIIEEFAKMNLEFLKLSKPPDSLSGEGQHRIKSETWGDDFIKACLLPYISLLPSNPHLVHDLAKIYVETGADIKRVILRLIEAPVRCLGMDCPELIKLVEKCPKGSETLVTRVIHILTDKGTPSAALVEKVKELYNTRVSDVRFLIPVLNGLSKREVILALPKLIKLNPVVVREVFNRLLGLHGESPISPSELLVALHLIDTSKADLKTIIKAISLCLQEKQVYTQEVLAVVLQQLMDQTPLPTLLMRTVIQALGSYSRLSGFVMNILQRLILKQVWKQKVVWEGFIKCCQRTKPQSFAVLMQLPAPQLIEVLNTCPDLKIPLKEHLNSFSETQRMHIPLAVQEIILDSPPITNSTSIPPTTPQPVSINSSGSEPNLMIAEETHSVPSTPATNLEPLPPGME